MGDQLDGGPVSGSRSYRYGDPDYNFMKIPIPVRGPQGPKNNYLVCDTLIRQISKYNPRLP